MIYLFIICIPVFLMYLSDYSRGLLSALLVVFAIIIPCFFAGVRDNTVGTDVMTYAYWTYYSAKGSTLASFLSAYAGISAVGFNAVSWLMAQFGTFSTYLGVLQLLVIAPFFLYSKKLFPRTSWIAAAVYMFLLFPASLNLMKQMIAVALCVPTFELVRREKPITFCIFVMAIALLFHQTAIVALVYYPAVGAINSIGSQSAFFGKAQGMAVAMITCLLFLLAFEFGNMIVSTLSILKESYSYQANVAGTRLNYSALVLAAGTIVVYCMCRPNYDERTTNYLDSRVLGLIAIVGALAVQINIVAMSLMRFSYYALSFLPLFGSSLAVEANGRRGLVCAFALVCLCAAYFYQAYVLNGGNHIFPYTSAVLGIC